MLSISPSIRLGLTAPDVISSFSLNAISSDFLSKVANQNACSPLTVVG